MCDIDWYTNIIDCNKGDKHNFIIVSYAQSPHVKQATTLMCSHCLQIINFDDVVQFNHLINLE